MKMLLCLWAISLYATHYSVGPTRSTKTLNAVVSLLNPGDTVDVDGDTAYTGGINFTRAGTVPLPIVIRGIRINGKRPIIRGGTNTVTFSTSLPYSGPGADNYVFEGFDITGGTFRGVYLQAHNLLIRDVVVHDCAAHGVLGADQGSGNMTLEQVEVYNCGSGASQHQIYVSTDQINHPGSIFKMRFCYLHDAKGGNNVKSRAERNEIEYNWIEGAYYHELELIGPDPGGAGDLPGWTPELKREDSEVLGNVLIKKATAANNDINFSVVRIGGDGTGESNGRYRFLYNTIIAGTGSVFRMFDGLESVTMHNNVIHCPTGTLNLRRTVDATWATGDSLIGGSNNWITSGAINAPASWTATIQGSNPGFVSLSGNNLRPSSTSPLRNQAILQPIDIAQAPFPSPSMTSTNEPPNHAIETVQAVRAISGLPDIGAFESQEVFVETGLPLSVNFGKLLRIEYRDLLGRMVHKTPVGAGLYFTVYHFERGRQVVKKVNLK